jgi:predicted glutamine amidotransferase
MCRRMAWLRQPVLVEELLFKTQHGIVDQSLNSRMGAEPTNGDGFGYGSGDGPGLYHSVSQAWGDANLRELMLPIEPDLFAEVEGSTDTEVVFYLALTLGLEEDPVGALERTVLWAVRYATSPPARSLFASADVDSVRRLHAGNPRLQRLSPDDRLIVSEPFSDLPGIWEEIPESTAVTVRSGGVLEQRPFRPRVPDLAAM